MQLFDRDIEKDLKDSIVKEIVNIDTFFCELYLHIISQLVQWEHR